MDCELMSIAVLCHQTFGSTGRGKVQYS